MNLLIVDDARNVAESIKAAVHWEEIGIHYVFTAQSAKDAKSILQSFSIDILITDIEMPEEDGIMLTEWAINHKPGLVTIFLTSHAEFDYAKKGINLGVVSYILQPARYDEVKSAVLHAVEEVRNKNKINDLARNAQSLMNQRDIFLDAIISQLDNHDYYAAETVYLEYLKLLGIHPGSEAVLAIRAIKRNNETLVQMDLGEKCGAIREFIESYMKTFSCTAAISRSDLSSLNILLLFPRQDISETDFEHRLKVLFHEIEIQCDCLLRFYIGRMIYGCCEHDLTAVAEVFGFSFIDRHRLNENVLWQKNISVIQKDYRDERMEQAIAYIRENISKPVSRSELADQLALSEEYFSVSFREYTGWSFKEYLLKEKMKIAAAMLVKTKLPIGIIGIKVGFENASHFSKTFKGITGVTPQEYRTQKKQVGKDKADDGKKKRACQKSNRNT